MRTTLNARASWGPDENLGLRQKSGTAAAVTAPATRPAPQEAGAAPVYNNLYWVQGLGFYMGLGFGDIDNISSCVCIIWVYMYTGLYSAYVFGVV